MIIDGHTPGIIVPQSRKFEYNFDLIAGVLTTKQNQFDTAYAGIQKLKRESLNIQFINQKEQGKIDAFNDKINNFFNGINDLGDLSQSNITSRYTGLFNEIGQDTTLISRYRQDSEYKKELAKIEEKKNSDDPKKAGFSSMYYDNYLRRLGRYAEADLDKENVTVRPYTNYVDIVEGSVKAIKMVPIEKFRRDRQLGNGYIERRDYVGRNKEKVSGVLQQYMQTDGAPHLLEQAEYHFNNSITSDEDKAFVYQDFTRRVQEGITSGEAQLQQLKDQMVGKTGQELEQAVAQVAQLEDQMANLRSQEMSYDQFYQREDGEIISSLYGMQMTDFVGDMAESYGGYAESVTYEPDRAFLALQQYDLANRKFEVDTQFKQQELALDNRRVMVQEGKLALEAGTTNGTVDLGVTGTADPSRLEPIKTFETLQAMVQTVSGQLASPFSKNANTGMRVVDPAFQSVVQDMWNKKEIPGQYANNPHLQAYNRGLAEARRMGKTKEEAMNYAHDRVQAILTSPEGAREIEIFNQYQDLLANQKALATLAEEAAASGNPTKYISESPLHQAFQYSKYVVNPEYWGKNKAKAQAAEELRNVTALDVSDVLHTNATNQDFEDDGYQLLSRISPEYIEQIEKHPDGRTTIILSDAALKEATDNQPGGPLTNKYIAFNQNGVITHQKIEGNVLTLNVPKYNVMNASMRLGLHIDQTPMTKYAQTSTGSKVAYQMVRDERGGLLYKIPGYTENIKGADREGWVESPSSPEETDKKIKDWILTQ